MTNTPLATSILIVGGGHGAASIAGLLRQQGCKEPITIIGKESHLPYQRPPLSKEWLTESPKLEALLVRNDTFYRKASIELRLNAEVDRIERAKRCVRLSSGEVVPYRILIIATGARARELDVPGARAANVFALRDVNDGTALKNALQRNTRIAIIGGGYVGLEVAASATDRGAKGFVFEREKRLLPRVASPELSAFFESMHRQNGVTIEKGVQVVSFESSENKVRQLKLSNGKSFDCDAVLIGVGAIPNDDIARNAGLSCDGGIIVNENARTSEETIFAIGDCTRRPIGKSGKLHRLESVPNVLEQAKQAAAAICGRKAPDPEVPWFWSTQYKKKLQIAGIAENSRLRIARDYSDRDAFCVFHLDKLRRLQCVEAFNAPTDFAMGRKLIAAEAIMSEAALNNLSIPLAECFADKRESRPLPAMMVGTEDRQIEKITR